jgi:Trypsin-co-occurring domain 1
MSRIIEFRLDDGGQTTVLVEADDSIPAEGQRRVSIGGLLIEQANKALDNALSGVWPIAAAITRNVLDAMADAQEIEVELGFKLTADAGVILARTAAEGHCKVSIKCIRKP